MLIFKFAIFLFSVGLSRQLVTDELRTTSLENPTTPLSSCDSNSANVTEPCIVSSCNDATRQGRHMLQLNNQTLPFPVFCVLGHRLGGSGGWVLVQQRIDGSENFVRGWVDYREGFGNMNREYWLGLERLHQITNSGHYELVVDVTNFDGTAHWARYTHFAISGEDDKYRLRDLGTYSGNQYDALRTHVGMQFSTFDSDNDGSEEFHCSVRNNGGWWFTWCISGCNLNGLRQNQNVITSILWHTANQNIARSFSRMLVRRV